MRTTPAFFVRHIAIAAILMANVFAHADTQTALDQFRGKVVVVDFWASWCGPCRQSFPWLNSIAKKYRGRGLVVVGVNVDRERSDADRFLKENSADFPIIFDPEGTLATQYQVAGMPSSFVLAPDGRVVAKHVGFKNSARAEREAELEQTLVSEQHR